MADFADVAADIAQTDLEHTLQNARRIEFQVTFTVRNAVQRFLNSVANLAA